MTQSHCYLDFYKSLTLKLKKMVERNGGIYCIIHDIVLIIKKTQINSQMKLTKQ